MKEIEIKVKGMVCEGCENRVKNALSTIDGIERVEANHITGIVRVILEKEIEKSVIEEKINDLGFETVKEDV
ncbi:MAG: heavy-metal-associated domain-containing protein [Clostridia bacterium]|nr:heavy-metal-associated domain-containing protein [Clostridia bacterium]